MAKYRKKPIVIEAVQYTPESCVAICAWIGVAHEIGFDRDICGVDVLSIPTPEGVMEASPGDYIVRGVKGEFYPVKPDIFAATYEPVEADR